MQNPYQQFFHLEPEKGLLNDPNGLAFYKGKYYFFHQWNRFETTHAYKEWGLFTSFDLINWEAQGSAVLPDTLYDADGVYSGSGMVNQEQYYLFYTGNTKPNGKRKSYQCISVSSDGRRWIKQPQMIETPGGYTEHFRDPKVIQGQERWWMLVGAQNNQLQGKIALFSSVDLLNWHYENDLTDETYENMCECPDLIRFSGDYDVLLTCCQVREETEHISRSLYGYVNYTLGKFCELEKKFKSLSMAERLDEGTDFYAPQTFQAPDGRVILSAWMNGMDGAMESACPTVPYGYLHCLTFPRQLTIEKGKLIQQPIAELQLLRTDCSMTTENSGLLERSSCSFELSINRKNNQEDFQLQLRNRAVIISFQAAPGRLTVSRISWVTGQKEDKTIALSELSELRVLCDSSSIEMFFNYGTKVFSMRYFTKDTAGDISYSGIGAGGVLKYYSLK